MSTVICALAAVFVIITISHVSKNVIFELKELNKKISGVEEQLIEIRDELTKDYRFGGVKKNLSSIASDVSCLDNRLGNICDSLSDINSDLRDIKLGM